MVKVAHFKESNIENSFVKLSTEVKRNAEKEELKGAPIEKVLKYTLENYPLEERKKVVNKNEDFSEKTVHPSSNVAQFLPSYIEVEKEEVKQVVENLIATVFNEGLEKALKLAKKYPPFVVDAFHDALVDKMVPELKKRNLID